MHLKVFLALLLVCAIAKPEAKNDYPGVADPFADPSQYEFSDDEKEDKEFFHLGRFFMLGFDIGAGIFTGGLGSSSTPGLLLGGRVLYFIDKLLAFEGRIHVSQHQDDPAGAQFDVTLLSYGGGFRYYFDIANAPKAIAIANPYLALAGAAYQRNFNRVAGTANLENSVAFGASLGGGVEFLVYRKHIYLGLDLRYHLVLFPDENLTVPGDRSGDYLSTALTMTYNF